MNKLMEMTLNEIYTLWFMEFDSTEEMARQYGLDTDVVTELISAIIEIR